MRIAAVLLVAAACGASNRDPREGTPPKIDVACVVVADGALCSFTSRGGPGERCVRAVVASGEDVLVSDEVCSGKLRSDGVVTVTAKLPTRPGDMCGENLVDCTLRVAEPAGADALASSWRDELGLEQPQLSEEDCERLWSHNMELQTAKRRKEGVSPADVDAWRQTMEEDFHEDFTEECKRSYTRPQLECALQARDVDTFTKCE